MIDEQRIQAEIGGAARVDPETGVHRPGYMIRDFTVKYSRGDDVRISSLRSHANLVLVFSGHLDGMRDFLAEAAKREREFSEQEAGVLATLPHDRKERRIPTWHGPLVFDLYDETLTAHHLSGATDKDGHPVPLVYVTDRFGEIVSSYSVPDCILPSAEEILRTLEFINHQGPECDPLEWPR